MVNKDTRDRLGTVIDSSNDTEKCIEFIIGEDDTPEAMRPELQEALQLAEELTKKLKQIANKQW